MTSNCCLLVRHIRLSDMNMIECHVAVVDVKASLHQKLLSFRISSIFVVQAIKSNTSMIMTDHVNDEHTSATGGQVTTSRCCRRVRM